MEPVDIISYWRNILCAGQYGKNIGSKKTALAAKAETKCLRYNCAESIKKVTAYTGKKRLQEFICLYALYVTLHKMTNETKIGLMVRCKSGYFPLVYQFGKQQSVKEEIQQLYEAYKTLFVVSQYTNAGICKYLSATEKDCIDGSGHMYFSYQNTAPGQESFVVNNGQAILSCHQDTENSGFVKALLHYYNNVLHAVVEKLQRQGMNNELSLLNPADRRQLLSWSNGKVQEYAYERSLYQLFRQWVERKPDRLAVSCGEESMTYQELHRKVKRIGHQMLTKQIQKGDRVAILCENSCQTIAAVLAIWAIGAVYVPVGTQLAYEKVQSILAAAKANLFLLGKETMPYKDLPIEKIVMGEDTPEVYEELPAVCNEELHMIFTSGTTGKPKAVMIEKEGFLNLCQWYSSEYHFDEQARSLLLTNYSFDASVKNLIVPLITGGQLHIVSTSLYDLERINRIVEEKKITHINCVPSLLDHMLELEEQDGYRRLDSLRVIILGGEKFTLDRIQAWREAAAKQRLISNVYGPTEATDLSTYHHVREEDLHKGIVPIGKPLDNKRVYILDDQLELCPCYKTGMLYVAGVGVIRGYFGSNTQKDKFIESPYTAGEILYATGDLARWNGVGEIEYVGRCDHQVKINGQRIELEEIESIARLGKNVKQSAAIVQQTGNSSGELIVFYSSKAGERVEKEALKKIFLDHLPSSLQPNRLIEIEAFPINDNGKIDRKALRDLATSGRDTYAKVEKPKTKLEEKILAIWRKILERDAISIDTPFFEAGGNSLLLNTLKIEVDKLTGGNIKLTDFFEYPTVEMIAKYIERR